MSQENGAVQSIQEPKNQPIAVCGEKTKYFRGRWAMKSNPTDIETVRIGVNGEVLQWQRGVPTIVPEPYLMAAKNSVITKFTQEPGKGRKISSRIERFPFEMDHDKSEATYAEFRKDFLAGSKKTREAVSQFGLNIPTENSIPQI